MRQFRFKCITVNTNFILGPWSDPNLSDSPWIWFLVHIDGNCQFSEIKKKGVRTTNLRMHNNAVHIECVVFAPSWWLSMVSGGLILRLFHGRSLVHLFQLFLTNKTRRWRFHVECITICFEFYIFLDHDSTQAFWLFMGLGITFSLAFWSKLGPCVPFWGGGFVLQKYEKGSFPCLTENILVVIWFYGPVVRTHHIILVTNDRYLIQLSHFYSQYREKGTFPRQLDYSITPFFWGGTMVRPYGIRASLLRKHNNAVHTRRTCDTKKNGENRGAQVPLFLGWSYDISILSILEYFFWGVQTWSIYSFFF